MATVKYYLKNKANKKGLYPIYLMVTKNGKQKMISVKHYCEKNQWDKKRDKFKTNYPDHNVRNQVLFKKLQEALTIIDKFEIENKDWQLDDFERAFKNIGSKPPTVAEMFDEHIAEFQSMNQFKSAKNYKDVKSNLIKYAGENLTFKELDRDFLEKYAIHLSSTLKGGGKHFIFRHLKTIVNKARRKGVIPKQPYCFDGFNISRFKSESIKDALTRDELRRFKNVDLTDHPHLIEAHNYFLFSVYSRGMNFRDMAKLKWNDIKDGRIVYIRSKTKTKISLEVIQSAQDILNYYKAQNRPTKYVFPILLSEGLTPKQKYNREKKVLRRYNKKLKEIAKLARIDKNLTSYVARHSFATILKMSGTSTEIISEMISHGDVSTTNVYLRQFSNEVLDEANRMFEEI